MIPSLFFLSQNDVSTPIRIGLPANRLSNLGYSVTIAPQITTQDLERNDIFIFCRPHLNPGIYSGIKDCALRGKTIIIDNDDDFHHLPVDHPAYSFCGPGAPEILRILEKMIGLANVVTFSTPQLAQFYRQWNDHVYIIPNGWSKKSNWEMKSPHGDTINIGWAGTKTHYQDVAIIQRAIHSILQEFRQTHLVICGDPEVNSLFVDVPSDRKTFFSMVSYSEYPSLLSAFDILLAPLKINPFNQAKSDIKLLEAGIKQIPFVASPTENYKNWGQGGIFADNEDAWYLAIKKLVLDAELRTELGRIGYLKAKTRQSDVIVHKWIDIFTDLGYSLPEKISEVNIALSNLLDADDILSTIQRNEAQLTKELLSLVIYKGQIALETGDPDLAEGFECLANYLSDAIENQTEIHRDAISDGQCQKKKR